MSFGTPAPHLLCLDINSPERAERLLSTIYKWYILHSNAQKLMYSHKGPYTVEFYSDYVSVLLSAFWKLGSHICLLMRD